MYYLVFSSDMFVFHHIRNMQAHSSDTKHETISQNYYYFRLNFVPLASFKCCVHLNRAPQELNGRGEQQRQQTSQFGDTNGQA